MRHPVARYLVMIVSIGSLGVTIYHVLLAQQEYYDPSITGERPGQFIGEGAERLGLRGTVTQDQFKSLLQGFHPDTGEALRKTAGKQVKTCMSDVVLSPEKSFSVSWALAPTREERAKLEDTFHDTSLKLIERIEGATFIRTGKDSTPVPAKPVITRFIHTSSRSGDLQYHAHICVHNIAVTDDGRTGAILSRPFYVRSGCWSALATCDQNVALRNAFPGIRFRDTESGPEIDGIPTEMLRHFSKRRRQIEAELANMASTTGAARQLACLKTRERKQTVSSQNDLIRHWRQEAVQYGFRPRDVARILQDRPPEQFNRPLVLAEAVKTAVTRLTDRHSHFSELELVRHTAQAAAGKDVTGQMVEDFVSTQLQRSPEIAHLGKYRGRERFSTPTVLAQEEKVLTMADKMTSGRSHRVTFAGLCARLCLDNLTAVREWLTLDTDPTIREDQRQAIKSLAQDSGQLALFAAPAGTAKHDTLARLGRLNEASGYSVLAAAPTGVGVRRLAEESELPAMPLRTLLNIAQRDNSVVAGAKHAAKQLVREAAGRYIGLFPYQRRPLLNKNTVVIVDGAQQISTQDMGALLKCTHKAGAKLVLAGSPEGLQAIERGVPFSSFLKRFPTAELTGIVRPERPQDAQNVRRARAGKSHEILNDLAQRGRLHVAKSRESAIDRLITDWQQAGGAENAKDHVIFAPDKQTAIRLNHMASEVRRHQHAADTKPTDSIILPGGEKLYGGDRVLCRRAARRYGIEAPSLGTVLTVSRRLNAVRVELDGGDRVTLPMAGYPDLTRAYALTVWQAAPTQNAYLLLGGGYQDRHAAVVELSRAAQKTHVYTDRDSAGKELKDLVRQLATDRTKTLATDVRTPTPENEPDR